QRLHSMQSKWEKRCCGFWPPFADSSVSLSLTEHHGKLSTFERIHRLQLSGFTACSQSGRSAAVDSGLLLLTAQSHCRSLSTMGSFQPSSRFTDCSSAASRHAVKVGEALLWILASFC